LNGADPISNSRPVNIILFVFYSGV